MFVSVFASEKAPQLTSDVERQADPSTMDTYRNMLNLNENTRYAGRLWSDKTVFSYDQSFDENGRQFLNNTLQLSAELDGTQGKVNLDADFMHIFSVLGSSQKIDEHVPIDLMLSIDITASMLDKNNKGELDTTSRTKWEGDFLTHPEWYNCNLKHVINSANSLMKKLRDYSQDSRISVVVYWGTAYQVIPFVDGDVQFTGYSVRRDNKNPEAILHYKIEKSQTPSVPNGEYVYDPVSGAHYLYPEGSSCPRDDTDLDGSPLDGNSAGNGQFLKAGPNAIDFVSKNEAKNVKESGNSLSNDSPSQLGAGTDVEAGIYTAMKEVAAMQDIQYEFTDGRKINRIPAVIILGDGATNHLLVKADDSDRDRVGGDGKFSKDLTIGGKWWEPLYPQKSASAIEDGSEIGNFVGALQAAYWKAAIKHTYQLENISDLFVYTIGVGKNPIVLNPTMEGTNLDFQGFDEWKRSADDTPYQIVVDKENLEPNYDQPNYDPYSLGRPATTYYFKKLDADDPYQVKTSDLDLNYPTKYLYADTGIDVEAFFETIFMEITGKLFSPVSGSNDLGVEDAVTYKDPIGKYMEIKDIKNLVLFGQNYEIVRTAMYNHSFVTEHRLRTDSESKFQPGWYHIDKEGNWFGDTLHHGDLKAGLGDSSCYSETNGSWDYDEKDGSHWVYYIDTPEARKYVPTLPEDGDLADLEIKNPNEYNKLIHTTYTFFRTKLDENERRKLRVNPAYLTEDITEEKILDGVSYREDGSHLKQVGVYTFSDLRIWVENTGDYSDGTDQVLTDINYDEALFVNLPVNMLPLRTVNISQNQTGGWDYKTNLPKENQEVVPNSPESASFPLRIIYTVGMAEEFLTSDRRIDFAGSISAEYLKDNKIKNQSWADARALQPNDVEFFSNWYNPENRYNDYATSNIDFSFGDPVVTFSPSIDNQYFIFQKPSPLYRRAIVWVPEENLTIEENKRVSQEVNKGGLWKFAIINEDYEWNEADDLPGETFSPGDFGGLVLEDYLDVSLTNVDTSGNSANQANQNAIWDALTRINNSLEDGRNLKKGTVVFLKNDLLRDVTKPSDNSAEDPFASEKYYFITVDYYELHDDGTATPEQYALTRKGSEFGSGYQTAGIKNGDMLCWHDLNGIFEDQAYASFTDTGDSTRGKPSEDEFEGSDFVLATKTGGLRVGALAQAVGRKISGEGGSTYSDFETYKNERFPNRMEDSSFRVGYYGGNTTRTSNNYYMPVISTRSSAGMKDIIVNTYLGNNGRLWTQDTLLLLTKLLESETVLFDADLEKKFDFQVTIQDYTGVMNAVLVKYNETTKSWQKQMHHIDLELNGKLFLIHSDGRMASVERDGELYYVYIGRDEANADTSAKTFRLYHNPYCEKPDDQTVNSSAILTRYYDQDNSVKDANDAELPDTATGKLDFYAKTVTLVPVKDFNEETWNADTDLAGMKTENNFYLATFDPTNDAQNDSPITGPYRTQSTYLTQEVYFGIDDTLYDDSPLIDGVPALPANTAKVQLKTGWGFLFSGIASGTYYRLTEKISDTDKSVGYSFKSVTHKRQADEGEKIYSANDPQFQKNIYPVTGDTGYAEEAGHFVNEIHSDALEIAKILKTESGSPLTERDKNTDFAYTVQFTGLSDSLEGLPYWKGKTENVNTEAPPPTEKEKIKALAQEHLEKGEMEVISPTQKNTYTFTLKGDESLILYDLPIGVKYTVTETKNSDFPVENDGEENAYIKSGEIHNSRDFQNPTDNIVTNEVFFTNVKPNPEAGSIVIEKQVYGKGEVNQQFDFTINLTIPSDEEMNDIFSFERLKIIKTSADGSQEEIQLSWKEISAETREYQAAFTLKQGEKISIDEIPYNSKYTIAESNGNDYFLQRVYENSNPESPIEQNIESGSNSVNGNITKDNAHVSLVFENFFMAPLPSAGGIGINAFYALGFSLIALASLYGLLQMNKKKREKN